MAKLLDFDLTHDFNTLSEYLKSNSEYDGVLLFSLEESLDWDFVVNERIPKAIETIGNIPYKIVLGDTCSKDIFDGETIIRANPFLLKTVYRVKKGIQTNTKWNSESSKALILTGKPHRENRIGFIIECVKRGILKNHIYSLFKPKEQTIVNETIRIFTKMCNWNYDSFFKEYENNPDNIDIRNHKEDMHYSGFPFSSKLYEDTLLSVVLETNLANHNNNNPDFSEKTYKAIVNKHPFLISNMSNSLWFLEEYGFHTFLEYFKIPEYDSIENLYDKNKAIIDNLEYFIETYESKKDEINQKVEDNYNLMIKIHDDFKQRYPDIYSALMPDFFRR